ncbi:hypothetical protein ACFQX6_57100 [Streptosporangium lutulentum]
MSTEFIAAVASSSAPMASPGLTPCRRCSARSASGAFRRARWSAARRWAATRQDGPVMR